MTTDIIFDFFGTLAQYDPSRLVAGGHNTTFDIVSSSGVAVTREAYERAVNTSYRALDDGAKHTLDEFHMRDWARAFSVQVGWRDLSNHTLDRFISSYLDDWNRTVSYAPHVAPFLRDLSARYRLSVISNTHEPQLVPSHVRALGVDSYTAQIVTSVEFGRRKPHPSIFMHALDRLSADVREEVYVGDDYAADYVGATSAGMRCILIDPKRLHPELGADRVESLAQIEERL